jgi:TRAP-type uncharacterized transport system fused permease subunit
MGTDPIKTGVFAARVAIPKYFIGITLILSFSGTGLLIIPVLQTVPLGEALIQIIVRYSLTFLAVFFLNVAVVGYFNRALSSIERVVVGACATLLFYPSSATDLIGFLAVVAFLLKKWIEKRKKRRPLPVI